MIEVGQFFKKGNKEFGLIDIIEYEGQEYYYFSIEEDKKFDYKFYTIKSQDEVNGYDFEPVKDEALNVILLGIEMKKIKEEI